MNLSQAKLMKELADVLIDHRVLYATLNGLAFDMRTFLSVSWQPDQPGQPWCKTSCCAMGLACLLPSFNAAGLSIENMGALRQPRVRWRGTDDDETTDGFEAAARVFGISMRDAYRLFSEWQDDPSPEEEDVREKPEQVAERLYAYIRESGHGRLLSDSPVGA